MILYLCAIRAPVACLWAVYLHPQIVLVLVIWYFVQVLCVEPFCNPHCPDGDTSRVTVASNTNECSLGSYSTSCYTRPLAGAVVERGRVPYGGEII